MTFIFVIRFQTKFSGNVNQRLILAHGKYQKDMNIEDCNNVTQTDNENNDYSIIMQTVSSFTIEIIVTYTRPQNEQQKRID